MDFYNEKSQRIMLNLRNQYIFSLGRVRVSIRTILLSTFIPLILVILVGIFICCVMRYVKLL